MEQSPGFEAHRAHLQALARKMLGSPSAADDAVQETWLRLSRADVSAIENLGGWLTTVVARVCLDMLRARATRREEPLHGDGFIADHSPERDALLAEAVGPALLVVLDTLAPAERVAFVLHDLFGMSFDEIAPIVGRAPAATRQLASRGRRRVQGVEPPEQDRARQHAVVRAFLAASRSGDLPALLALLDPDVVLRADEPAVRLAAANAARGAPALVAEARGADVVAGTFKGQARGALPTLIDGELGATWSQGGVVRAAFAFTVEEGLIVAVEIMMAPEQLASLRIEKLSS